MTVVFNRIHHVAIIVGDYKRSRRFYTEILGLPVVREIYRSDRLSHKLDLQIDDKTTLEIFSFPNSPHRLSYPEAQGLRHLAFAVSDIDLAIEHLRNHGVEVEPVRIDEATTRRFTFLKDPDGLPIELYEVR